MSASISEFAALLLGLVVSCFLWRTLFGGERLGRGRGRELRHEHPVRADKRSRSPLS